MDWHSTEKLRNGLDPRGKAKELLRGEIKRKGFVRRNVEKRKDCSEKIRLAKAMTRNEAKSQAKEKQKNCIADLRGAMERQYTDGR